MPRRLPGAGGGMSERGKVVVTTAALARLIAADPRFNEPGEAFFDELAAVHGREETAVAWVVARLDGPDDRSAGCGGLGAEVTTWPTRR
jgi:hypothetical protein